jgi:hypothetical protein
VNDSKTKTTRRNYGATAKTRTKATAKAQGTTPKAPPKAKPKKPSAKELTAARKLLLSAGDPISAVRSLLLQAKCSEIVIAGKAAGGYFTSCDFVSPHLHKMVKKAVKAAADRAAAREEQADQPLV